MALNNVKKSLPNIAKNLSKTMDARDYLIKQTRNIFTLCSQAIIAVHEGNMKQAKTKVQKADSLLKRYQKKATPDLQKYLVSPEQELVEAYALIAIVEGREIPPSSQIKVSDEAYVLGLLDCIGELKRQAIDNVRHDKLNEALKIFDTMEGLYLQLYPFAVYDKVVKEARRKLDVNRSLIEDVRGIITEEVRRSDLIKAMKS